GKKPSAPIHAARPHQVSGASDAELPCNAARALFCRADELERLDNLFAVRMLVDLASSSVGEFMFVVCRHWIAEHQRGVDPDSTWLHVPITLLDKAMVTESQREHTRSRSGVHRNSAFAQA